MDKGIAEALWRICHERQNVYHRLWCNTANAQKAEEARQECAAWATAANDIYQHWLKREPQQLVETTKENHINGEFSIEHAPGDTGATGHELQ